jgi:hypothetical protein
MDDNFKNLRQYLIKLAISGISENYKRIIENSDVDFILSDDNSKVRKYLEEILEFENYNQRPLVTVFAVLKETNRPKEYFYKLVKNKDIFAEYVENEDIYKIERDASTEFWRNCENYDKFYEI